MGRAEEYISIVDPAVDIGAMGESYARYMQTADPDLLRYFPGQSPTVFVLALANTTTYTALIESASDDATGYAKAFASCVKAIRNVSIAGTMHASFEPAETLHLADGSVRTMYSQRQLDMLPPAFVYDVGRVAKTRSFLARSTGVSYPVPLTLLRICQATYLSQSAALTERARRPASPTCSQESPPAEVATPASGEQATAATAEVQ